MSKEGQGRINLAGKQYGRLTVLSYHGKAVCNQPLWLCRCQCGVEKIVFGGALRSGLTTSCGCFHKEAIRRPRPYYPKAPENEAVIRTFSTCCSASAKNRGLEFSLSDEDVESLIFGPCFYCGSEPTLLASRSTHSKRVQTKTKRNGIDRVDTGKGYIRGNVVSCCTKCNKAKMDMSVGEFIDWIRSVYEHSQTAEATAARLKTFNDQRNW